MMITKLLIPSISIIIFCAGCASHAPVLPQNPKSGVANMGFQFSVENVIPVIWWKYGINDYTEFGFKMGMPISGAGVDISRVLMKKDYRWDVLNLAYNYAPNPSFDLSYYMFKAKKSEKVKIGEFPLKTKWRGFRCMIIPDGTYKEIEDNQSIRFGFLFGRRLGSRWGFETGYFHDFKGGFNPANEKYPHKANKWPTQFSRGAGVSMQLFFYLPSNQNNKK